MCVYKIKYALSITAVWLSASQLIAQQKNSDYPIQPIDFTHVHVHDNFWAPKMELNANVTIPYVLQKCRETGRVDNFLKAAGKMPVGRMIYQFLVTVLSLLVMI